MTLFMADTVAFYQLSSKFVSSEMSIPEKSRQVVYYSLAIGHHVGVMDCFTKVFETPLKEFEDWVAGLPEGSGKQKLEGLSKWGEIEIGSNSAADILRDIPGYGEAMGSAANWVVAFGNSLKSTLDDPAVYVMGRKM